jgi:hypothetical protein
MRKDEFHMKHSRVLVTLTLGLGLTLALLWVVGGISGSARAERDLAFTPAALNRPHDPVVIAGGLLPQLTGSPVDEILVYAIRDSTPIQIPFQIDERDASGMYVPTEDGQLDANDELVFMAMDAGGWAEHVELDVGGAPITPAYVITLTDPIDASHAWAYVFRSADLAHAVTADYVSFDGSNDRITSSAVYAMGFNATYTFRDYMTLGESSVDLLDRDKVRIAGSATIPPFPPFTVSATEQDITKTGVLAIDGPVRVTRVSTSTFLIVGVPTQATTTLFAYRSTVVQPAAVSVPGAPVHVNYFRLSVDWNEMASGMTYYDANNPAGVSIDGAPDALTLAPATGWTQVSSSTGTLVNVIGIPAGMGGTQSTYYKDDSAVDSDDTGDQLSYGDAGFRTDDPNPGTYTILGQMYFLTGTTTNVGATYVDYYEHPLQVEVAAYVGVFKIFLPLLQK